MIQYIQVETDDDGMIVGLGFVDSMTDEYWAAKKVLSETSGLPADASTKDHISRIKSKAYVVGIADKSEHVKNILAKHSGLAPSNEVSDHIAAIKLKAHDQGYDKGWSDKQADLQKRIKQFEESIRKEVLDERETE